MAQTLDPDPIKSVNGNFVVDDDSPQQRGRPRKLDVARFLRICALIQEGKCNTAACRTEGVDYTTFRFHARRKPSWQKRYLQASDARDDFLRDLYIGIISQHSKESWQAAAWLCERKWPHLFALHFTQHRSTDNADKPIYAELTKEQLLASIKRAKELADQAPVGWQPAVLPDEAVAG